MRREVIALTPAGRAQLEQELGELRAERLPWFVARLAELRDDGAMPGEDVALLELHDAYARARYRAAELTWLLYAAVETAPASDGIVALGSRVTIEEDGEHETVQLVSPCEANAIDGRITVASPVGRRLLGCRVGDRVEVSAPGGERRLRIVALA